MLDVAPDTVVAVDGGGTRCRVALASHVDCHIVEVGSANVSTDFNAAVDEIALGLQRLSEETEIGAQRLRELPAYLGIAGAIGPKIVDDLSRALPLDNALIEDDRRAALIGALGNKDGAVAHCGTGSFIAASTNGDIRLVGGWGPVLGDEASAQWVGRKTLAATMESQDGLSRPTTLIDEILDEIGSSEAIITFAAEAAPADFGQLAKRTTAAAANGDAVAVSILSEASNHIACTLPKLGWTKGMALCLTGGIGPEYAAYLPEELRSSLTDPAGTPLDGAIALARSFSSSLSA